MGLIQRTFTRSNTLFLIFLTLSFPAYLILPEGGIPELGPEGYCILRLGGWWGP